MGGYELRKYLDKQYEAGGRGPDSFDCYGLASVVYEEKNGVALPELWTPESMEKKHELFTEMKDSQFQVLEEPRSWCLIAFSIRRPFVTHIGVVLDDRSHFIHILKHRRVTIERFDMDLWRRKIEGFYEPVINSHN
jgi:hypothetical protein